MRRLILSYEGAPMCFGLFSSEIRSRILFYGEDEADLLQVWSVPEASSHEPGGDITEQFAVDWSREFFFADSHTFTDATGHMPAFVREAAHKHLIAAWTAGRADTRSVA